VIISVQLELGLSETACHTLPADIYVEKCVCVGGNHVPRNSHLPIQWSERRETLAQAGHMSYRIWGMAGNYLNGGA